MPIDYYNEKRIEKNVLELLFVRISSWAVGPSKIKLGEHIVGPYAGTSSFRATVILDS